MQHPLYPQYALALLEKQIARDRLFLRQRVELAARPPQVRRRGLAQVALNGINRLCVQRGVLLAVFSIYQLPTMRLSVLSSVVSCCCQLYCPVARLSSVVNTLVPSCQLPGCVMWCPVATLQLSTTRLSAVLVWSLVVVAGCQLAG